jgi:hypothetical protein
LDATPPRIHIPANSHSLHPFPPSMFYRTLVILFLSLVAALAEEPPVPLADFAGVYPTNSTVVSLGLLQSLAPGAKIIEAKEGDIVVFLCDWPDVTVKIRVDPKWDQPYQIKEMKRWITMLARDQKDNPIIKDLVTKLESTKNCFGCAVLPKFDPGDKAVSLLLALTSTSNGLIYAHHTFYDANGNRILGTEGDPARMQYTKD